MAAESMDRADRVDNIVSTSHVRLREYIDTLLAHERELRERSEDAAHHALELQAREYERRLEDLNHAHTQTQSILSHTVSREMFENYVTNMAEWRDVISQQAAEQRGATSRQMYLIGLAVTLLALGLRFLP